VSYSPVSETIYNVRPKFFKKFDPIAFRKSLTENGPKALAAAKGLEKDGWKFERNVITQSEANSRMSGLNARGMETKFIPIEGAVWGEEPEGFIVYRVGKEKAEMTATQKAVIEQMPVVTYQKKKWRFERTQHGGVLYDPDNPERKVVVGERDANRFAARSKPASTGTGPAMTTPLPKSAATAAGLAGGTTPTAPSTSGTKGDRKAIAKAIMDGKSDKVISGELHVAASSVYVVRRMKGPDGKYSSGRARTAAELDEIARNG
jgi:hypothetical protein